jgi:hypothetical protein
MGFSPFWGGLLFKNRLFSEVKVDFIDACICDTRIQIKEYFWWRLYVGKLIRLFSIHRV